MTRLQESTPISARRAEVAIPPGVLPDLAYTPEVARETAHLYERVSRVIPPIEWPGFAPYIKAINDLKRARNAVVLAHNYMTPEIFHCVADVVGDSLQLAREASKADAEIIVQGGVHFMAETSKLLNPDKMVLIPDFQSRLFAGGLDHWRRCARLARGLSRRARGHLCQHLGRSEGRMRHLLHLLQRRARRRVARAPSGSSSSPTSISPNMWPRRPQSRSSPGRAIARCTSASPAPSCAPIAKPIPA